MKIIGSYVSPYVRKVLACMALKGVDDYEIDPITPFFGGDEFARLSPLRRIPVLVHGDLVLNDSSVICEWLDEAFPGHPLLPADPADRARARWLEEFADTRMGDVFIWGLFYQKIVHPLVWGEPGDPARIDKTLADDAPAALDYLEDQVPRSASPTSPSPAFSATLHMPASRSMPRAGRRPRPSSSARSRMTASPGSSRSRMRSCPPIPRAAAPPCSPPARRSARPRSGRASR